MACRAETAGVYLCRGQTCRRQLVFRRLAGVEEPVVLSANRESAGIVGFNDDAAGSALNHPPSCAGEKDARSNCVRTSGPTS